VILDDGRSGGVIVRQVKTSPNLTPATRFGNRQWRQRLFGAIASDPTIKSLIAALQRG
jgi:hypothetical protein